MQPGKSAAAMSGFLELAQIPQLPQNQKHDRPAITAILSRASQWLLQKLWISSQLQIWQTQDASGQICWSGYDPKSQRSIHQVSEAEIRTWIEHRDRHESSCNCHLTHP